MRGYPRTSGLLVALAALATAGSAPAQQPLHPSQGHAPGWLGIGYDVRWVQESGRCDAQVLVEQVVPGSPAERAGLRAGDLITAIDDRPLPAERIAALGSTLSLGDSVRLRIDRDGRMRQVIAVAARRPDRPPTVMVEQQARLHAASPAPVVHVQGEKLVAHNIDGGPGGIRGYWLSTGTGDAEYRRLTSWSRSAVDERVAELLRCAESAAYSQRSRGRVDLRQLQRRADSLRVMITRRAMEREEELPFPTPPAAPRPPSAEPPRVESFVLRLEDHVMAGLRGVAGAEITELAPELAEYFPNVREGLLVLRVAPATPAARAGLRPGDVVVRANGRSLESVPELRALLSAPDRQAVELRVVRRGQSRTLTLRLK